jgi:Spy/CpxP family protein refolding chaperone
MSRTTFKIAIATAAASGLLIVAPAFADPATGPGPHMGQGMMGYGGTPGSSLSEEQRTKAIKIQDGTRKKMWESMGAMFDASSKLRDLFSDSTRDRAAISAAYRQVAELRQKMFETDFDAQEEFERILTADQKKQLRR